MNPIEAVAKAIRKSAREEGNDSPVDYGDALALARTALEALADNITPEMVEAAWLGRRGSAQDWRDGIRAALVAAAKDSTA